MKKIDWYLLRNFLTTFFFCIFIFAVIAVVIDTGEKTDDFVKSGLPVSQIIMQYFIGFVPHIIALLFPLFVFIAVIFFTSKLANRTEIVAILASGTSFSRFLRSYWVGGIGLATLLLVANHFIVPKANVIYTAFKSKYVDGNSSYNPLMRNNNNVYFQTSKNSYVGIHYYDTLYKSGGPFFYYELKGTEVVYNMRAESIRWDTTTHKWILVNVFERRIKGLEEQVSSQTELYTKALQFKPYDLQRDEYAKDKLSTPALDAYIDGAEDRGMEGLNTLKVERYRRDATAFSVILLTLIGAIIASRKIRGGSGNHLAAGILLAVSYILMDKFSTVFSTKSDFPPLLAAWTPNIIFSFVAMLLYRQAPK
ncbi:MAG TPA: permease [Chitinophagaceae bacterium]|nr:permease [Chitinophagaceae bacterium]